MSGGWNPVTGRDSTGSRPFAPAGPPVPSQGQPYVPHLGGPGYNYGTVPQYPGWGNMAYGMSSTGPPAYTTPSYYSYATPATYGLPPQAQAGGFYNAQSFAQQPNGTGNILLRQPQPCPNIDSSMPAAQMTNTSGGMGCEPGYNYFFPAEHTKAHIFKSDKPPWQLPANAQIPFLASHIPCSTTLGDMLKGFGCYNPNPRKNKCFEMMSAGNGKWYKGFSYSGEDEDKLGMTIKEVGWDSSRDGKPGGKPVVCLWFCKN